MVGLSTLTLHYMLESSEKILRRAGLGLGFWFEVTYNSTIVPTLGQGLYRLQRFPLYLSTSSAGNPMFCTIFKASRSGPSRPSRVRPWCSAPPSLCRSRSSVRPSASSRRRRIRPLIITCSFVVARRSEEKAAAVKTRQQQQNRWEQWRKKQGQQRQQQ